MEDGGGGTSGCGSLVSATAICHLDVRLGGACELLSEAVARADARLRRGALVGGGQGVDHERVGLLDVFIGLHVHGLELLRQTSLLHSADQECWRVAFACGRCAQHVLATVGGAPRMIFLTLASAI